MAQTDTFRPAHSRTAKIAMQFNSIDEIFETAEAVRKETLGFAGSITPEESGVLADGETWTLRSIFEHMALVDDRILWVVDKLAAKADSMPRADGTIPLAISDSFGSTLGKFASEKLVAPETVQPTGEIPIADSILRLEDSLAALASLREGLENADLTKHRIPHPYLGELTAPEWMVIRNGHEERHVSQARVILDKIRQK